MNNSTSIHKLQRVLPNNKTVFLLPLLLLMLLCNNNIYAISNFVSNGTGGGIWNDVNSWGEDTNGDYVIDIFPASKVPDNTDLVVYIQPGDVITVTNAATAHTVQVDGTLTINNGNSLTVNGFDHSNLTAEDFTITGTVNNTGTLTLDAGASNPGAIYSNLGAFNNNGGGGVFTMDNGGIYTEYGTLTNAGTINITSTTGASDVKNTATITNTGTMNMGAGSNYYHIQIGGTIPTCTWNATSNCIIAPGATGAAAPGGLTGQSFGNFTWDWALQNNNVNLAGNLTAIQGNLTIVNIGSASRQLQLATTTSPTINITGNLNIQIASGANDIFALCTTGSPTINVGGNLNFSGAGGRLAMVATGAYAGTATLNVEGNFTYSPTTGGYILESSTTTGKGIINFSKTSTQTFNTAVTNPFANSIEVTINSSSTLDMSASTASWALQATGAQTLTVNGTLTTGTNTVTANSGTTFSLASGATLNTSNASGVNSTIVDGTGTRNFDPAANYVIGGAATGFTGTGAPTTMNNLTIAAATSLDASITVNGTLTLTSGAFTVGANTLALNGATIAGTPSNLTTSSSSSLSFGGSTAGVIMPSSVTALNNLTINNSSGVALNSSPAISGTLTLTSGTLSVGSNTLTLNSTVTQTAGSISSGNTGTVSYNQSSDGQNVISTSYGNLTFSNFNKTLPASTVSISNTFTPGSATGHTMTGNTISFNGTGVQTISTAFTYNNLTINNAAGVSISAGMQTVTGTLAKTSGTLTTNSLLTIASSASGDGRIDGGAGTVSGNVVMQRYIAGSQGYRMIGAPTTNASIANLNTAFLTRGFPGSDVPIAPKSISFYNEVTGAYTAPTGTGEAIIPSRATYTFIWTADLPATISFTGPTKSGTESFGSITYNAGTGNGWNIAANPYPSQIDWDDAAWSSSNVSNSYYVYDDIAEDYRGYQSSRDGGCACGPAGAGGGSATNIIASSQGFWVKATGASPTLSCTEAVKTTSTPTFYKTSSIVNNSLRLKVLDSTKNYSDAALILFKQNASTKSEPTTVDMERMYSSSSLIPNLSTLSSDSVNLAINTFPDLTQKYSIPVVVKVNTTGTYTISAQDIQLPASACIMLEDLQTGTKVDLRTTASYSFTMTKGSSNTPRFLIHFSPPTAISPTDISCSGKTDGAIMVRGQADGPWSYIWKDSKGTTIKTAVNMNSGDSLKGLSQGTYFLTTINTGGYCNTVEDSVFINAPDPLSINATGTNVTCNGSNDGTAKIVVSGGAYPYSYSWSNGDTVQTISNLTKGNYSVTIVDKNNCSKSGSVLISDTITADFTTNVDTIYLSKGGSVVFTNSSTGANNYQWNFGDGTTGSTTANPTHTYSQEGDYTVKLISENGVCKDTFERKIIVLASPLAITENSIGENILVINQNNGALVQFNFPTEQFVQVKVYNILAQKIWETKSMKVKNDVLPINLNGLPGIYFINFEMEGKIISKKFNFTK